MLFESIMATDNWTVVFTLKEPQLDALRIILNNHFVHIYPPDVIKEHGDATGLEEPGRHRPLYAD